MSTLQGEVTRLTDQLAEERAAVLALKRQSLAYQTELDQVAKAAPTAPAGTAEMLTLIQPLLDKEANPVGERYAVSKVVQAHNTELRASFLYYCQLDSSFSDHWPPTMHQHQWFAFCQDSATADPRIGARQHSSGAAMLPMADVQSAFDAYAKPGSARQSYPVLTFEAFVAAVAWVAARMRLSPMPFLSEALRAYVLKHVLAAKRVQPGAKGGAQGGVHNAATVFVAAVPRVRKGSRRAAS